MKEKIFTGDALASTIIEAEAINDYNSIRFWVNGIEVYAGDVKMVVYQELDAVESIKDIEDIKNIGFSVYECENEDKGVYKIGIILRNHETDKDIAGPEIFSFENKTAANIFKNAAEKLVSIDIQEIKDLYEKINLEEIQCVKRKKDAEMESLIGFRGSMEEIKNKINLLTVNKKEELYLDPFENQLEEMDLGFNVNIGILDDKDIYLDYSIFMLPTMKINNYLITEINSI